MTAAVVVRRGPPVDGALDGLVAADQRIASSSLWVHLERRLAGPAEELEASPDADPDADGLTALQIAADRIHMRFEGRWVPIAAPAQETAAWLNSHLLYLIPPARHPQLAQLLEPANIDAAVAGIRARLTSPLFAAAGDAPRRDPLGLSALLGAAEIGLRGSKEGAEASSAGDLQAVDGGALLLELRADDDANANENENENENDPKALITAVREAAADPSITVRADGIPLREAASAAAVKRGLSRTLLTASALVMMILALGLRRMTPLLISAGAALSGLAVLLAVGGPVELLALPILAMMIGACGEGEVQRQRQRIAVSGWAGPLILATALLPLLLSPYPLWHRWALAWFAAISAFTVAHRLLSAGRKPQAATLPGASLAIRLRPWPTLAVLLCGGMLTAGALLSERLEVEGPASVDLRDAELRDAQAAIRHDFFDPDALVTLDSRGDDLENALERSIADARAFAYGFTGELRRLDSPGAFVIDEEELDRRREALHELELQARMIDLEAALRRAELRPQAFSEFLKGAVDLRTGPSAATALAGPLSGWIAAHQVKADGDDAEVEGADGAVILRSRAFLDGEPDTSTLVDADGEPLALRGPILADAAARSQLRQRLGIYAGAGLWIGALIIWLATRSLALALAAGITAVAAECALIILLWSVGIALSPALLPVFLLVGAAGMIAGGRACRSVDRKRPLLVGALLLASLCQVAGGLALLATPEPAWQRFGLALASGCAIAPALGIFATPGLYRILRRALREDDPSPRKARADRPPTADRGREHSESVDRDVGVGVGVEVDVGVEADVEENTDGEDRR